MFALIAEAAGPDLTNESWAAAVDDLGSVSLVVTEHASFGPGKYDGNDAFRLVRFDPATGENGDWEALSDVVDVGAG
jgi:hypothetical protein